MTAMIFVRSSGATNPCDAKLTSRAEIQWVHLQAWRWRPRPRTSSLPGSIGAREVQVVRLVGTEEALLWLVTAVWTHLESGGFRLTTQG